MGNPLTLLWLALLLAMLMLSPLLVGRMSRGLGEIAEFLGFPRNGGRFFSRFGASAAGEWNGRSLRIYQDSGRREGDPETVRVDLKVASAPLEMKIIGHEPAGTGQMPRRNPIDEEAPDLPLIEVSETLRGTAFFERYQVRATSSEHALAVLVDDVRGALTAARGAGFVVKCLEEDAKIGSFREGDTVVHYATTLAPDVEEFRTVLAAMEGLANSIEAAAMRHGDFDEESEGWR